MNFQIVLSQYESSWNILSADGSNRSLKNILGMLFKINFRDRVVIFFCFVFDIRNFNQKSSAPMINSKLFSIRTIFCLFPSFSDVTG